MTPKFLSHGLLAGGLALAALPLLSAEPALAAGGPTLDKVKARGELVCPGHDGSFLGFAEVDDKGAWKGFDIDLCKAFATAVLGEPKVKIVPISWAQRWPALQSGDLDVIIKNSGATLSRDTELGTQFSMPYYLGATKIMAHKELGITSLKQADGGSVCIPAGTTQQSLMAAYTGTLGITMEPVVIEKTEELEQAYYSGRCDTYVQFEPVLAISAAAKGQSDQQVILDDVLKLEPIVMIMRQGDENWVDISNWLITSLLFAEQEGITAANVDAIRANPPTPTVAKFLGATPGYGAVLGLPDDYAYTVIKTMGNYGEIFERNLGMQSPYKMGRGMGALWKDGGALYPLLID